jgi:hypothetical protein
VLRLELGLEGARLRLLFRLETADLVLGRQFRFEFGPRLDCPSLGPSDSAGLGPSGSAGFALLEQTHPCCLSDLLVDTSRRASSGSADQTLAFGVVGGRCDPTTKVFEFLSKLWEAVVQELTYSSLLTLPA